MAERAAAADVDGVGLLRIEFMVGEITGNEAEVRLRTGFDLLEHAFEEGGAFFVNEMDVVDGGETEIAGTGFALGAQCSRPKTERQQCASANAEHLAAGNRAVIRLGSFHAVMGVVAGCRAIFKVDQA